jgi:hypothetical protein
MNGRRATLVQLAVAILGIVAVGSVAFGIVLIVASPGAGSELGDSLRLTAFLITAFAGFLAIAFGALAGIAARMVWIGRPVGRLIGFAVVLVAVTGPVVAGLSGGFHPALFASVGLGVVLGGCLLLLQPDTAAG